MFVEKKDKEEQTDGKYYGQASREKKPEANVEFVITILILTLEIWFWIQIAKINKYS